jgi:UDP-2,4-diacetamido-2,4,6-trideoxy-beta-L-altropyranose hydrolase
VDGYHFDANYQQAIKQANLRLLFIDDYGHASHYYADLVLNQNIYAGESLYANREPYTRLLLGTSYALLRREFWKWRGWRREIPEIARKVLVTLGGGDPDNVTLKVIQALQQVEIHGLEAIIVIGGSNPHQETLKTQIANAHCPIQLERNVTDMPALMAWADVAISAGGSTCWELAFMGLPSLILVLAENQQKAVAVLSQQGIMINLGAGTSSEPCYIRQVTAELLPAPHTRHAMMQKSQGIVDGMGAKRTASYLQN